jgi:hypothetical protein
MECRILFHDLILFSILVVSFGKKEAWMSFKRKKQQFQSGHERCNWQPICE